MIGIVLAFAFVGGLLARWAGLPPLVGFLFAGFALRMLGLSPDATLDEIAHAGVLVLLFSVGLKFRLQSLLRAEVLGTSLLHLALVSAAVAPVLFFSASMSVPVALLVAMSLGLSSTVVAAKMLEEKRELGAFHGRVAIGILVIQDLVAVMVLGVVTGGGPSWWSPVLVVAIFVAVPLFHRLLLWSGHGEMIAVFGLTMTFAVGASLFTESGLSPELGALLMGSVMASHRSAGELAYRLWSLKEILLVGFFVSIGMAVDPDFDTVVLALVLVALLPVKAVLFFALLVRFKLRARSSFLAAIALASFSEFGLIVAKLMHDTNLLNEQWLSVIGIASALSFVISAPINRLAHPLFEHCREWLSRFELAQRHPDDEPISVNGAEVVVFGMGRVGAGAYDYLRSQHAKVIGFDSDHAKVERHLNDDRQVVYADAEDPDLWARLNLDDVRSVMLALPDLEAKITATQSLRRNGYSGFITATNVFEAEAEPILNAGCDATFNYFQDAGFGFAKHSWDALHNSERAE